MKNFIWLLVFIPMVLVGQSDYNKKIYLDSLFHETDEINHVYFRVVSDYLKKQKTYKMVDYYKSGAKYSETYSKSNEFCNPIGLELRYYETGEKKESIRYGEQGKSGPYATWYENGNNQIEGTYQVIGKNESKVNLLKIDQFWAEDQVQMVKDGNGTYELHNEEGINKGIIKDGLKDGVWSGTDTKYKYSYAEKYANGKLTAGVSTDRDSIKHIYHQVEIKPEYVGGINEFYKFISKNFKIPDLPGLQGKLFISFVIQKDGSLDDIKILRSLGRQLDEEGYRVLSISPPWKPGELRGIKVRVRYSLPITIQSGF